LATITNLIFQYPIKLSWPPLSSPFSNQSASPLSLKSSFTSHFPHPCQRHVISTPNYAVRGTFPTRQGFLLSLKECRLILDS
jgi:hypothetical protein